jgi:Zn-dependent protease with chaperone function
MITAARILGLAFMVASGALLGLFDKPSYIFLGVAGSVLSNLLQPVPKWAKVSNLAATMVWLGGFLTQCDRAGEIVLFWIGIPMLAATIAVDSLPWTVGFGLATLVLLVARQKIILELLARSRQEVALDSPLAIGLSRMAADFGVQPKRFLLIPSLIANGGALPDGTIIMTAGLREVATDEEVVAILAHEFSHAKDGDAKKLGQANAAPLGLLLGIFLSIAILNPPKMTHLFLPAVISTAVAAILLLRLPVLAYHRRLEYKCDGAAAAKGYGPDLASGLEKLHRYMGMPPRWGGLDAPFLTHPSLADRMARLVDHPDREPNQASP